MTLKSTLYDILGVNKDASTKEIKDAYRNEAKKSHPDKGGEKEKFQELTKAYQVLINPTKKKRYDEIGDDNPEKPFEVRFMGLINQIFIQIIEKNDIEHTDLIHEFRIHLEKQITNFKEHKKEQDKKITKFSNVRKRTKSKSNQTILSILDGHIKQAKENKIEIDEEIKFVIEVQKILVEYNYDFEKIEVARRESDLRFNEEYRW